MKKFYILLSIFVLSACRSGNLYNVTDEKTSDEKIIAFDSKGKPWGQEIERRLREKGFKVYKYDSTKRVQEEKEGVKVSYKEASTRYHLKNTGKVLQRCVWGGYFFEYYTAELIDKETNEVVAYYEARDSSENCYPAFGSIFEETVDMVNSHWN